MSIDEQPEKDKPELNQDKEIISSNNDKVTENKDEPVKDEITENIKAAQEKEISYILEASQADEKRTKFLAKLNEYKIAFDDGTIRTIKRKPLSSRKNKEIDDLRSNWNNIAFKNGGKLKLFGKEYESGTDILYDSFRRTANYCLGLTDDEYDNAIWEDDPDLMNQGVYGLRSIVIACLMRAVHGVAYFRPT